MPSGFGQTFHGFLIRRWNRAQRHGLSAATHPNEDSSGIQGGVFRGNEDHLRGETCSPSALQQFYVHNQILNRKRASLAQHRFALVRNRGNEDRESLFKVGLIKGSLTGPNGACDDYQCWFRFAQSKVSLSCCFVRERLY